MKFLCKREFIHSGVKTYVAGMVYVFTALVAATLIALDPKKELGALSFFEPVDEEAINFVKEKGWKKVVAPPDPTGAPSDPAQPKPPTKAELVAKAKALGIKATNFMSIEQLQEVIAAAEKANPPDPTGAGNVQTPAV